MKADKIISCREVLEHIDITKKYICIFSLKKGIFESWHKHQNLIVDAHKTCANISSSKIKADGTIITQFYAVASETITSIFKPI